MTSTGGMLTRTEARRLALSHIARTVDPAVDVVIRDTLTRARTYGWIFFYNARAYVETGDPRALLGGTGPVIVLHDGTVHVLANGKSSVDGLARLGAARRNGPA